MICNKVHFADTNSPWHGDTWQLHVINIHYNLATTLAQIGFIFHLVSSWTMWGSRVQSIFLAFIPQTDYGNEDKFRWIRVNFSGPALCKHWARCSLGYGGRQLGVTLNNYNNLQRGSCPIDPLVATQLHLFSRQRRTFNACRVMPGPEGNVNDTAKSLTWRCHK